jgi:tetratricopeptide (TPR) repeat protein
MKRLALALPLLAVGLCAAGPLPELSSNTRVIAAGNAEAAACSQHAILAAEGRMSPAFAVQTCSEALQIESLSTHDLAATHNNRGVLYLTMAGYGDARADFEAAAKIQPDLSEVYVNRGAAQVEMGMNHEAIADIEKAMAMGGLKEPWKAYYNRGLARENLGDLNGAYADYMKAQELRPDWEAPKTELARFHVKN